MQIKQAHSHCRSGMGTDLQRRRTECRDQEVVKVAVGQTAVVVRVAVMAKSVEAGPSAVAGEVEVVAAARPLLRDGARATG